MITGLPFDFDVMLNFLKVLREGCSGTTEIRTILGKSITHQVAYSTPEAVIKFLQTLTPSQAQNFYFGVGTRKLGQKGGKETVKEIPAFWLDIDIEDPSLQVEIVKNKIEDILILNNLPLPNIWVKSGHGLHPYWLLASPILINDTTLNEIEGAMIGLRELVSPYLPKGAKPKQDSVHDISRIMRLPGSLNFKDLNNIVPVEIMPGARVIQETKVSFQTFLPIIRSAEDRKDSEKFNFDHDLERIDISQLSVSDRIKNLIQTGSLDNYPSRSERDQAVIDALILVGVTPNDIKAIFEWEKVGDKYREKGNNREEYLSLSINKAYEFVKKQSSSSSGAVENLAVLSFTQANEEQEKIRQLIPYSARSGIQKLDDYIRALIPGQVTVLSGETGMGKTLQACLLACNITQQGKKVLFFSLESGTSIVDDICAIRAGKPKDQLTQTDRDEPLKNLFIVSPNQLITLQSVEKTIAGQQPDVVILDHIHYLAQSEKDITAKIGILIREIVTLARKTKVHFIVLAHVKKPEREGRVPGITALKDSSALYQDPTTVLIIHRFKKIIEKGDELEEGQDQLQTNGLLLVGKNRNFGRTGVIKFDFDRNSYKYIFGAGT